GNRGATATFALRSLRRPNRARRTAMTETLLIALVALMVGAGLAALLCLVLTRARTASGLDAGGDRVDELTRLQTDAAARLETMLGMLAKAQMQLQHNVNERLDSVSHRLGESMERSKVQTTENLQRLNERLAVIDSAQKNITELASQVTSLQSVLTNKQQRRAFGQGRMEIFVQDGLPE